jgi:hypothetical protein
MVLLSRMPDAIPHDVRILGEEALFGPYVQTGVNTRVRIDSCVDKVITYYARHLITHDEYEHYMRHLSAVWQGYYFDSRFTLAQMDDPRIRMNMARWLEKHGDIFVSEAWAHERLIDDLEELERLDEELWGFVEQIPDEDYRPDVTEVVDLTGPDIDLTFLDSENEYDPLGAETEIDWDAFDNETISLLSGFDENMPVDFNVMEAFEPPTEFEI